MFMARKVLEEKLKQILAEDVVILAKEAGVAAGVEETAIFMESLGLSVEAKVADGDEIRSGTVILKISGSARAILSAERTILNLLSRMSGIATKTRRLTEKLRKANLTAKVAATRKTAPGLLYFDKKAVLVGGGDPHRLRLDDMILLKDNHVAIAGSVENAVKKAKAASVSRKIEAEVTSVAEALKAAEAGADIVMLDNFSPKQVREAVEGLKKAGLFGKVLLEVSGGITEQNLLGYASEQVDVISIGALTHSVKALDISLEVADL
jgi:nicotinate-nucleotide pyrophosphorylase (carboxylating)